MRDRKEHHLTPQAETERATGKSREITVAGKSIVDRSVAPWSARTDRVVRWIGGHAAEIAVVGGTAVAGLVGHPAWWAVTVPAAAGWIANEHRLRRQRPGEASTPATPDASGPAGTDASRVDAALPARHVESGVTRQDETTDEARNETTNEIGEVRRGLA